DRPAAADDDHACGGVADADRERRDRNPRARDAHRLDEMSREAAASIPTSLTPEGYELARRALMRRDPILGAAIKRIGPCLMADRQRSDHLSALVGAIVSQQLSTKAASTIFGRFVALFPDSCIPDAAAIAAQGDAALRAVGLSGQKVGYLRDLSTRI